MPIESQKNWAKSDEKLMAEYINHRRHDDYILIYKRYFMTVKSYINSTIFNQEDALDIAQDIFVKIYTHPDKYDPQRNFKPWLYTIVNNKCKNYIRDRSTRKKHQKQASLNQETGIDTLHTIAPSKNELVDIYAATKILPNVQRETFQLKYKDNLTVKEISAILNISEGTVKSRLHYALDRLRNALKK